MVFRSLPRGHFLVLCVVFLLIVPAVVAKSDVWNASWLASDSDWPFVYPNDVNESGKVIGFWTDGSFNNHAIVWDTPTSSPYELEALSGDTYSWAADVNAKGTVCGTSGSGWPASRAAMWDDKGNITDMNPDGWDYSDMWCLNDPGEAVGSVWDEGGWPFWACYWSNKGEPVILDDGGFDGTWAIAISKSGLIVGQAYPASGPPWVRACYWDGPDGELVDIHDAIEDAIGESLWVSLSYEATDGDEIAGWAITADDFQLVPFVYTEADGVTILDDGGTGDAFVWQSAGKYLVGAIGGNTGFVGDLEAAVWERGTEKGETTWTLHRITNLAGYEMLGIGVNQEGNLIGAAADDDGNVRAWYAKRSGK